jgi:hypothetical protein
MEAGLSWLRVVFLFLVIVCLFGEFVLMSWRAVAQVAYPEEEIRVRDLPALTSRSSDGADVLATALEIIIHKKSLCCGKNSALEDSVERVDSKSPKDIANRLKGRHLLSDGRPIMVTTEFLAPDEVNAGHIIYMLEKQHAPLMEWNSQLYVVNGVTYVESEYNAEGSTSRMYTIHTFLLDDVRYSGARREVIFDRTKENATQVQGFVFVDWQTQ